MRTLGRLAAATATTAIRTATRMSALTTATRPAGGGSARVRGSGPRRAAGGRPFAGVAGDSPRPVVLMHGYLDGHLTPWWDRLTDALAAAGLPTDHLYTADTADLPGIAVGHPRRYAMGLQAALDRALDRHGRPATVIGHSMGGLVGRYCVERGDGADDVADLVTLGTPHQGTYAAYLGYLTPGGRALIPGSSFLSDLNRDPLPSSVRYTSLYSVADPLVRPAHSGRIPTDIAAEDTANIRTGRQSHVQLVHDPEVFAHYADRLF